MTENGGNSPRSVGLCRQNMHTLVVVARVHRRLPADQEHGIVVSDVELIDGLEFSTSLAWSSEDRNPSEIRPWAEYLLSSRGFAPIGGFELPAIGAIDVHLVTVLYKLPMRMCQLAPLETNWPAGLF